MRRNDPTRQALDEPVALVAYDGEWPRRFQAERERPMAGLRGFLIGVADVGSTAVPGLVAKPVIDLLGGIASMADLGAAIAQAAALGYHVDPAGNAGLTDRRWLFRQSDGRRTHRLHLCEYGGRAWRERLRFCALLRADPGLCAAYARMKLRLAKRLRANRARYTAAKNGFIGSALATGHENDC